MKCRHHNVPKEKDLLKGGYFLRCACFWGQLLMGRERFFEGKKGTKTPRLLLVETWYTCGVFVGKSPGGIL